MVRTLLALLLLCFVSLHAALPAAAAGEEPAQLVSVLGDEGADTGSDDAPSPEATAKCHDSCSWLAEWHVPVVREAHPSSPNRLIHTLPPGVFPSVVPPPR